MSASEHFYHDFRKYDHQQYHWLVGVPYTIITNTHIAVLYILHEKQLIITFGKTKAWKYNTLFYNIYRHGLI